MSVSTITSSVPSYQADMGYSYKQVNLCCLNEYDLDQGNGHADLDTCMDLCDADALCTHFIHNPDTTECHLSSTCTLLSDNLVNTCSQNGFNAYFVDMFTYAAGAT